MAIEILLNVSHLSSHRLPPQCNMSPHHVINLFLAGAPTRQLSLYGCPPAHPDSFSPPPLLAAPANKSWVTNMFFRTEGQCQQERLQHAEQCHVEGERQPCKHDERGRYLQAPVSTALPCRVRKFFDINCNFDFTLTSMTTAE